MKNTTTMRAFLALLCLTMVFSLFACDVTPISVTDVEETNAKTEAPTNESTENDATEAPASATTEAPTAEATEEPTEESTEAATTEEETTDAETEDPACEHVEEIIAGTAATCENNGLTEGKKCSACDAILVAQQTIPALGHAWNAGDVTVAADCENAGVKTFTCANDATHTKTEEIPAIGHNAQWQYVSNVGTEYEGTRYAVQGKICSVCEKTVETRIAVVAFNFDSVAAADSTGAATSITGIGTGGGAMVTDLSARVTKQDAIYLRNGENGKFIQGAGWIGVSGDIDTANGYYRIFDAEGNLLQDWTAKALSGTDVKPETAGSYNSVKNQLAAQGITDFTARGFNTTNLWIGDYLNSDKPISVEYAVKVANAPEGADLITVVVFKNIYDVCNHNVSDWHYISNVGTEWEGTGYAVEGGTCSLCGETFTRAAVVAFYFDAVYTSNNAGTGSAIFNKGSNNGIMVTDPDAREMDLLNTPSSSSATATPYEGNTYLRNDSFTKVAGWIGVNGAIDTTGYCYRVLDEDGNVLMGWTEKAFASTDVRGETTGSYGSVNTQLGAQGITDFTVYGFTTTNIDVTGYVYTDKPVCIEFAVKVADAPEDSNLITVMVFTNVYKRA